MHLHHRDTLFTVTPPHTPPHPTVIRTGAPSRTFACGYLLLPRQRAGTQLYGQRSTPEARPAADARAADAHLRLLHAEEFGRLEADRKLAAASAARHASSAAAERASRTAASSASASALAVWSLPIWSRLMK